MRLTIDQSETVDAGEFTVVLSNKHGKVSSTCNVTVSMVAPVFTQPLIPEVKVKVGDTADLTCEVTGVPRPEVQWFRGEELITEGPRYKIVYKDTAASLRILDVTSEDTVVAYVCKATNPAGEATTVTRLLPQGLLLSALHLFRPFSNLFTFPSLSPEVLSSRIPSDYTCHHDVEHVSRLNSSSQSSMNHDNPPTKFHSSQMYLCHASNTKFLREQVNTLLCKNFFMYSALLSFSLSLLETQTASCFLRASFLSSSTAFPQRLALSSTHPLQQLHPCIC